MKHFVFPWAVLLISLMSRLPLSSRRFETSGLRGAISCLALNLLPGLVSEKDILK